MAEWWEEFFGPDYLTWYPRQTPEEAQAQARFVHGLLGDTLGPVLDTCCGYGRHSLPLAELGRSVVGLDYSEFMLAEAARRSHDAPNAPAWVRGDMRSLPFDAAFGAVVNLFTSFGYFERVEDDAAALAEMARVLVPGGRLVMDLHNRDHLFTHPGMDWWENEHGFFLVRTIVDWTCDRATTERVWIAGARVERSAFQVQLYSFARLVEMLKTVGLAVQRVYGGLDGATFHPTGRRIVLVAEKPA